MEGKYDKILRASNFILIIVAVALGFYLRFNLYLSNRSFWLDAALLVLEIMEKSYAGLLGVLGRSQAAPAGFLVISKFIGSLFNYSELSLVFVPFVFGLAAIIVFVALAQQVLPKNSTFIAVFMLALSTTAICYSAEFKQYSLDLFFTNLILLYTVLILKTSWNRKIMVQLLLVGLISIWFSHTAIIILSGCLFGLIIVSVKTKPVDFVSLKRIAVIGSLWLANYLVNFLLITQKSIVVKTYDVFNPYFAPIIIRTTADLNWYKDAFVNMFRYPLGFGPSFILPCLALIIGIVAMFKRKRDYAILLIIPVILLIVASALKQYPICSGVREIHSRLLLFITPIFYLLIAEGIFNIASFKKSLLVFIAAVSLLLFFPFKMAYQANYLRQETKPLIKYYLANKKPEEMIYVYSKAKYAFQYYTRDSKESFLAGQSLGDNESYVITDELSQYDDAGRMWFLFSHIYYNQDDVYLNYLNQIGEMIDSQQAPGASLYYFDL